MTGVFTRHVYTVNGSEGADEAKADWRMKKICRVERNLKVFRFDFSDSGYICLAFHRRDNTVIELQQSTNLVQVSDDACSRSNFDPSKLPFVTLISKLPPPLPKAIVMLKTERNLMQQMMFFFPSETERKKEIFECEKIEERKNESQLPKLSGETVKRRMNGCWFGVSGKGGEGDRRGSNDG